MRVLLSSKISFGVLCAGGIIIFWMVVAFLSAINTTEKNETKTQSAFFSWNYKQIDTDNTYAPPQLKSNNQKAPHYLGTDAVGRDVAAGILHGAQVTLFIALGGYVLTFIIGFLIGAFAGFYAKSPARLSPIVLVLSSLIMVSIMWSTYIIFLIGTVNGFIFFLFIGVKVITAPVLALLNRFLLRRGFKYVTIPVDYLLMRGVEVFQSVPIIMWLLAAAVIFSNLSPLGLVFLVGLTSWMSLARLVRAEFFRLGTSAFVDAAKGVGASPVRIIIKHILPNMLGTVLVATTYGIASVIGFEALISYIGLGLPIDEVTWGTQLSGARQNFSAWWLAVFPGLAIFSVIFALNIVGKAFQKSFKHS